jgi:hypothetical protein
MKWLDCLEYELEYRLREIIMEHGAPLAVTDPKVKRLFDNLAAVRRLQQEVPHVRDHYRVSA